MDDGASNRTVRQGDSRVPGAPVVCAGFVVTEVGVAVIVRVQSTELSGVQRFVRRLVSDWGPGAGRTGGVALLGSPQQRSRRRSAPDTDLLIWTPYTCTLVVLADFGSVQHGVLTTGPTGRWQLGDGVADLRTGKSTPNPVLRGRKVRSELTALFRRHGLSEHIDVLVVLIPKTGSRITWTPPPPEDGIETVLVRIGRSEGLTEYFERSTTGPMRWRGEDIERAFEILGATRYLPDPDALGQEGFAVAPGSTAGTRAASGGSAEPVASTEPGPVAALSTTSGLPREGHVTEEFVAAPPGASVEQDDPSGPPLRYSSAPPAPMAAPDAHPERGEITRGIDTGPADSGELRSGDERPVASDAANAAGMRDMVTSARDRTGSDQRLPGPDAGVEDGAGRPAARESGVGERVTGDERDDGVSAGMAVETLPRRGVSEREAGPEPVARTGSPAASVEPGAPMAPTAVRDDPAAALVEHGGPAAATAGHGSAAPATAGYGSAAESGLRAVPIPAVSREFAGSQGDDEPAGPARIGSRSPGHGDFPGAAPASESDGGPRIGDRVPAPARWGLAGLRAIPARARRAASGPRPAARPPREPWEGRAHGGPARRGKDLRYPAVLGLAGVALAAVTATVFAASGFARFDVTEYGDLCAGGEGNPAAAPYSAAGPSPVYLGGELAEYTAFGPSAVWRPIDSGAVQLVACVGQERHGELVHTCQYPPAPGQPVGRTLNLFTAVYRLTVYEARTGSRLAAMEITGDAFGTDPAAAVPDACRAATGAPEDGLPGRRYSRPSHQQIEQALTPFVAPASQRVRAAR